MPRLGGRAGVPVAPAGAFGRIGACRRLLRSDGRFGGRYAMRPVLAPACDQRSSEKLWSWPRWSSTSIYVLSRGRVTKPPLDAGFFEGRSCYFSRSRARLLRGRVGGAPPD